MGPPPPCLKNVKKNCTFRTRRLPLGNYSFPVLSESINNNGSDDDNTNNTNNDDANTININNDDDNTDNIRWERPPPTYDEAMKHVNPDLQQRPPDPPPYSDSFRAR